MIAREKVLEQLVQRTNEGFWFIDTNAVTLDVNPAMCRILARSRDQILGHSIFEFVDDENLAIFKARIAERKAGVRSGVNAG